LQELPDRDMQVVGSRGFGGFSTGRYICTAPAWIARTKSSTWWSATPTRSVTMSAWHPTFNDASRFTTPVDLSTQRRTDRGDW